MPTPDAAGDIVLAGHFDPAVLAPLMQSKAACTLSALPGPAGIPIHQLAGAYAKLGLGTTVVGGIRRGAALHLRSCPLSAVIYNKRGGGAFVLDGWSRERAAILKALQVIRPSIVHAHWTLEAARAAADWNGPKVLTIHDAAYECVRLGWSWNPVAVAFSTRWLTNTAAILKRFRHIIAVSPFVEGYLRSQSFRGQIRVIPNPIPPLPKSFRLSETFPKTSRVTFACSGSPGRLKNLDAALCAFLRFRQSLPDSRLLVFGGGWERISARYTGQPIEFRGALTHVHFLKCLATEVDIWVHPSRTEAHPITLCEAIQAGCPVIAGRNSGGVPWTLDFGHAGMLVDIESPTDIAEAMLWLVRNRQHARLMVSYGRQMIQDRFNPELVVKMHLQFYREVIDEWNTHSKT